MVAKWTLRLSSGGLALAALALLTPVNAQAADAAAEASNSGSGGEIVVTATRREQALQDVPVSVVALSQQDISQRQIAQVSDLVTQVPGLFMGSFSGANLPAIRGVSHENTSGTEDPNIAVYIDGVYQARARTLDLLNLDLQSIEVLRGPQGTLYGRNATGGTINITTVKPSQEAGYGATAKVGNYDLREFSGYATGPITDTLAFRASAISRKHTGYTKNLQPNAATPFLDTGDDQSVRLALRWKPSSDLTVDLTANRVWSNSLPANPFIEAPAGPLGPVFAASGFAVGPWKTQEDFPSSSWLKQSNVGMTIAWQPSDAWTLKSVSAYQSTEQQQNTDADRTGGFLISYYRGENSKVFSQEFNLNGTLFDNRLDLLIGAFFLTEKLNNNQTLPAPLFFGGDASKALVYHAHQDTRSVAVFSDATLKVTDRFRVFGGIRGTWDRKTLDQFQSAGGATTCPNLQLKDTWHDVSPRVGAQVDVAQDVMVYGQWQRGFKAGGYNALACNNPFDQESVSAFEGGIRSQFADRRVTINLTAFAYKYKNLQRQQIVGLVAVTQNAAAATIRGIEAETSFRPFTGLELTASGSVLDAKYNDFLSCNPFEFFGNCGAQAAARGLTVNRQMAGARLSRAPKYTLSLGAQYTFNVGAEGEFTLRGQLYRSGEVVFNEFKSPYNTQKPYTLGDLFATYRPNKHYQIQLFMKNVGNVAVLTNSLGVGATSFNHDGSWAPPRTFGVELGVHY